MQKYDRVLEPAEALSKREQKGFNLKAKDAAQGQNGFKRRV